MNNPRVEQALASQVVFETQPDKYKHWRMSFDGPIATLSMDVAEDGGLRPDYRLKLNSYDLAVDIELADALQRIRFEHPEVHAVVITSLKERIFCAGANIFMLGGSSHGFKVNFCKFTNETRLAMEDASVHSGIKFVCAVNGICAGGGYELALACDEILLVDDGNSAVSLPEAPLLGVLPGTGGLTRLVDKRMVRRDVADFFSTLVEGVKGRRAVEWGLVDAVHPTSRFKEAVAKRASELAARSDRPHFGHRHHSAAARTTGQRQRDQRIGTYPCASNVSGGLRISRCAHLQARSRRRPMRFGLPQMTTGHCRRFASWTTCCSACG